MSQRGIAQGLVLFSILAFAIIGIGTLYFTQSNKPSLSPTPLASPTYQPKAIISPSPKPIVKTSISSYTPPMIAGIHLAGDASILINHIKLNLIIFQPQDVNELPYSGWEKYANDWFGEVISFWREELDHHATITFEIYPTIYKARKNAGDYDFNSVYQEAYPWLQQQSKFTTYFDKTSNKATAEFPIFFVYVLGNQEKFYRNLAAGSHVGQVGFVVSSLPTDFLSSFFKFHSEDPRVHGRGQPAQEAHEMGHALGLQHSSDDPNIKVRYLKGNTWLSNCDLMLGQAYNQNRDFLENTTLSDTSCIIPEQEQLFFK